MKNTVDIILDLKNSNVSHRDIKPNNFYITKDFNYKLQNLSSACKLEPVYWNVKQKVFEKPEVI